MMRARTAVLLTLTALTASLALADGPNTGQRKKPLFDTSMFRPVVVLHELPLVTDRAYVTVTGVVFSRTPVDRVSVGERLAMIRPAEPKDLVKIRKLPEGASDAPFRTYFEVPDAGLARLGANDLDIMAVTNDGRESSLHRITVIRALERAEGEGQ